jgi:copper chaperone CopZ
MTKLQIHYELVRPLTDEDATSVANVHGYYGIMRVHVAPSLDKLTVDYDASRLSEKDVEAALIRYGVPIRRQPVSAAG